MTDYIRNSWFGILYDLEGEPIAFSTGADNPDEPYIGETLTLIRGEKSTENTFIDLLHEMKRSRDPRTPRPLPEKQ